VGGYASPAPIAARPGEARLPWDDQEFSTRMLTEHLSDAALAFTSSGSAGPDGKVSA
jgi:hypothetical protein